MGRHHKPRRSLLQLAAACGVVVALAVPAGLAGSVDWRRPGAGLPHASAVRQAVVAPDPGPVVGPSPRVGVPASSPAPRRWRRVRAAPTRTAPSPAPSLSPAAVVVPEPTDSPADAAGVEPSEEPSEALRDCG